MMDKNNIRTFAQRLADNDMRVRNKALKMLKKHFKVISMRDEGEF